MKNISKLYDDVKPATVIDIKTQKGLSTIAANGFANPTIYSRVLSAITNVSQSVPKVKNGNQYISSVNYENKRLVHPLSIAALLRDFTQYGIVL